MMSVFSKTPFPSDVINDTTECGYCCSRIENLGMIVDTWCQLSADVNVRRIVGTRYFVEDRLGFGLIFKFVGKFELSSLLANRLAIFQEHILLLQISEFISMCDTWKNDF